ncbi:MAG: hypothetical protein ABIH20_05445 [Candidatus Diapherotrites archaeon]
MKTIKFSVFFLIAVFFLEIIGISIFSKVLFTPFGILFLFLSFLNEAYMISL